MNIMKGTVGTRTIDTSCPEMEAKRESNCVGGSFPLCLWQREEYAHRSLATSVSKIADTASLEIEKWFQATIFYVQTDKLWIPGDESP